jgi:tetratricopeptide (TPR) repeat protein
MKALSLLFCALLLAASPLFAQLETPQPSPLATVSQKVGLVDVTVTYSRPSARGREVVGELVPYGKVWRTGANQATKVSLSSELNIAGSIVPAGDYALFTIPGEETWTVIFNKNTEQSGTGSYDEAQDALRTEVAASSTKDPYETFTIGFTDLSETKATMYLAWEDTKVAIPLEDPNVDEKVMAQIDEQMAGAGDNAGLYYQAANYYFAMDKDMQQAQEWIDKAVSLDDSKFWVLHLQAKIHAKTESYDQARAAAKKSMELAEENGNQDYVRLNEKLLESMN